MYDSCKFISHPLSKAAVRVDPRAFMSTRASHVRRTACERSRCRRKGRERHSFCGKDRNYSNSQTVMAWREISICQKMLCWQETDSDERKNMMNMNLESQRIGALRHSRLSRIPAAFSSFSALHHRICFKSERICFWKC